MLKLVVWKLNAAVQSAGRCSLKFSKGISGHPWCRLGSNIQGQFIGALGSRNAAKGGHHLYSIPCATGQGACDTPNSSITSPFTNSGCPNVQTGPHAFRAHEPPPTNSIVFGRGETQLMHPSGEPPPQDGDGSSRQLDLVANRRGWWHTWHVMRRWTEARGQSLVMFPWKLLRLGLGRPKRLHRTELGWKRRASCRVLTSQAIRYLDISYAYSQISTTQAYSRFSTDYHQDS